MRQISCDNETIQLELEREMTSAGISRFRKNWNAAHDRGDVADQKPVKHVIDYYTAQVADAVKAAIKKATRGGAGRKNALMATLAQYDPSVLGYLTCRYVINSVVMRYPFTSTVIELGKAVEDEAHMAEFDEVCRGARKWVDREIKRRKVTSKLDKKTFHKSVARHKGVDWEHWTTEKRVQVGTALLHLFCESTGLVTLVTVKGKGKRTKRELKPADALMTWILETKTKLEELTPFRLPMVVPPKPWTNTTDGGYLNTRYPIVTKRGAINEGVEGRRLKALKGANLSKVQEALGHLDRTSFKINERVLEVLERYFETNVGVGSLPAYAPMPIPKRPKKADKDRAAHKDWCKKARNAHDHNALTKMEAAQTKVLIQTAQDFKKYPAIYFPHQVDFRGRAYAMPVVLNPQGPDHARSLLTFAEGKPVTDLRAMWWLMIHGANMWGYDKCSMDERVRWVAANATMIYDCAVDPFRFKDWHKADKPWSFLAWCFDFIDVLLYDKPSYIRVSMDGSCNGLQHFSAMTRDIVGAKAVNLAHTDKPADIYQTVADRVIEKLKSVPVEEKWMADTWLQIGVNRKLTKRSVMVMPYGGTRHSTMTYLEDELLARIKGKDNPFGDQSAKAVAWLATKVYDATREVVVGGKLVMEWLQTIARVAAEEEVHLKWTTPHGFAVKQDYRKALSKQVFTHLNGRGSLLYTSTIFIDTDEINPKLSCNGISPNFVHSLDACALMSTVNAAAREGVTHFHMVHDDYGTHAADTAALARILREQFVKMYTDHDVLADFRDAVLTQLPKSRHCDIPPVPAKGTFNLDEVLDSQFFFA